MKVLLITSKWSVPGEDIDGGSMTARDVLDTIAADSIVDLLLPEGYKGFNIIGAKNIFYYPIDDDIIKNYNGSNKFICRIKISRLVGTIVSKIHNNYDKIVILHTFHAFEICSWNNAALNKKIVLFPMLLTPSYINSGEIVPQYYIRNEKKTLKVVGKIITPSLYEQNQLESFYGIDLKKISCIPRFVNSIFRISNFARNEETHITICYIASFKKQKQNEKAVELLMLLLKSGLNVHLYLVGAIHDSVEYDNLIRYISDNYLNNHITIMNSMSQTEVNRIYSKAFINISVARCETFGRAIIEGLYTGLPAFVLKSARCFNMLIGENHGVDYFDSIEDMAKRIKYLFHNPDLYSELRAQAENFGVQFEEKRIKPILKKEILW